MTRRRWNNIFTADHGYEAVTDRFVKLGMSGAFVAAGISSRDVNRYGEKIAAYGWYHNSANGAAPGWIKRAGALARGVVAVAINGLQAALVDGAPSTGVVLNTIGAKMRDAYRRAVLDADLVETGDLLASVDFESPGKTHVPTVATTYRMKRAGGVEAMSTKQHLYNIWHKGRTKQAGLFRQGRAWQTFRDRYAASFESFRARHAGRVTRELSSQSKAAKAAYAKSMGVHGGHVKGSRAAWIGYVLSGGRA